LFRPALPQQTENRITSSNDWHLQTTMTC
jgi:hypothetical protein